MKGARALGDKLLQIAISSLPIAITSVKVETGKDPVFVLCSEMEGDS